MANPYFEFKQFKIYHDQCAMKVGTDGVLLGAWVNLEKANRVLDVGTGSGLIALMVAQRNRNVQIDAIDIDEGAVRQAMYNFERSPFKDRIRCDLQAYSNFKAATDTKYDVIVSNPPFFVRSLKSPDQQRTLARHTDSLAIEDLISISSQLLTGEGILSLILPYEQKEMLEQLADLNSLYLERLVNVYPTLNSQIPKRILCEFSKSYSPLIETDLVIEKERHIYSDNFVSLVKDFYLKY